MPKILIVDDDPIIRNLLVQILEPFENRGVELLTAENGKIALDTAKKERPDLVFLDVMMPKMNGFEVCNIIKHDEEVKNAYVVMLTAKGQDVDRQKAKDAGADLYITKPFTLNELLLTVSNILHIDIASII
jgi:two-component system, OmpR family, alkaline phosphatase synthesis response regulator PhoP